MLSELKREFNDVLFFKTSKQDLIRKLREILKATKKLPESVNRNMFIHKIKSELSKLYSS